MRQAGDYCVDGDDDAFERQPLACLLIRPPQHWIANLPPVMSVAKPGRKVNALTPKENV